jgi:lysophospholipase L1-like esterase
MMKKLVLRLITPFLLVSLFISVTLNLFLFIQSKQYYLQLNETRLDPLGLSYFNSGATENHLINSQQTLVVFFGDSRMASWPPPNMAGFKFINRGIGAQTSAQTLYRFDDHVKSLQPQIVVLQVGINDLKTIPLFPERKGAIIANCKENIQQIVTQSVNNGATVILTTIFPTGRISWARSLFWSSDVDQAVNQVNAFIRSLKTPDVYVLDAYSLLTDNGSVREELYQDTLHLNAAGYETLNVELERILASFK